MAQTQQHGLLPFTSPKRKQKLLTPIMISSNIVERLMFYWDKILKVNLNFQRVHFCDIIEPKNPERRSSTAASYPVFLA